MSFRTNVFLLRVAAVAFAGLASAACDAGAPTEPAAPESPGVISAPTLAPAFALGSTAYPGVKVAGKVTACKDVNSPAGTYSFTASASPTDAGDQITAAFTLSPGQCSIIWERTSAGGSITNVTVTESIPSGASYQLDHINAVDDGGGNRNVAGPGVTVQVKGEHGAVVTFFNVPAPPPPPTGNGHVVLCKSGNVQGTFTFNIVAAGTIAGDVVKSMTTLAAGSCDTVFVRASAGAVAATLTITESVAANATTYLQRVTVDGQATATVGAGVVVTQNFDPNRLVVFVNAAATVGATVAYHPNTQTPGVVHLCKSASSPPGTFTFNINAVGTVATDQIVSSVTLTAGTCKVIFIRTVPQLVGATLTITETLLAGTTVDVIATVNASGTVLLTGSLGVVVTENASPNGGTLVFFVNKSLVVL